VLYQLSHASELGLFTRDFRAVNSRNAKNLAFGEINAISGGQPNHVIAVAKRSFSAVIFRLKQCINGDRHPARCWPDDALGGSAAHRSGKGGSEIRATLAGQRRHLAHMPAWQRQFAGVSYSAKK
jgi:hypothetical protein